jgi:hypothetical protein
MLNEMTAIQFQEWVIFAGMEPFGPERMDSLFGSVVQVIANSNRDRKKKRTPYTLKECTLNFGDAPAINVKPKADWRSMKSLAKEVAINSNARKRQADGKREQRGSKHR